LNGKNIVILFVAMIIFVCAVCGYFVSVNFGLKNQMLQLDTTKKKELNSRLQQEKVTIGRDLEEKYRADMVSFEAMYKRLQLEKQKNIDLEQKLKKTQEKKTEEQKQ